jgi:hypothetical protein
LRGIDYALRNDGDADVTVSELAAFSYCAKAWHLERIAGIDPHLNATDRREMGTADHKAHGARLQSLAARSRVATLAFWLLLAGAACCGLLAVILG